MGLQQVLQLWDSPATAPDLTWWANVVTDAGHHAGGPRSPIARDALRDSDSRLVAFLDHLDGLGVLDDVTIVLTADHGFEGGRPRRAPVRGARRWTGSASRTATRVPGSSTSTRPRGLHTEVTSGGRDARRSVE